MPHSTFTPPRRPPAATAARDRAPLAWRAEAGFTLIEVMVAAMLLVVGVLGALAMTSTASERTASTKAREGATNLAREVLEQTDSLAYRLVEPTTVVGQLQAKAGLAPASGSGGWTVVRRGIAYGVSVSVCYVDTPADGLGAHGADFCAGSAGTADTQPVDLKRATVRVSW